MTVQIFVDELLVLTTAQAAEAHGYSAAGMRATLNQAGVRPVAHLDGRTPLYDPDEIARALAERPGTGAPGRPRRRRAA